ncbi:MAG: hypothetical protein CMK49_02885 [Prochlorococcus sp. SP3034]|nr:hypothetical protein [Prochlorococcus sp. SP3034]|tara:strand:+ start:827 stop:1207 length:381 start_codon:yes stop_codon:yes gene_type:complete
MKVYVLLYNSGSDEEGIHSIELNGQTIVLMFEEEDDAERYCGLLEAQDFPKPTIELVELDDIKQFCLNCGYESRLVERNFIPKTQEDRLLITPPSKNLNDDKWSSKEEKSEEFDLNSIKNNLEKLL